LYEDLIPPRRHIAKIFGDCLGVRVTDVRPDCIVRSELVDAFTEQWRGLPRPHIVVNRNSSPWTPNKDWPDPLWCDLIARLCTWGTVVEIGSNPPAQSEPSERYIDLRGRSTLEELVAVMAAADLHIGPVSGPVHIAAAMGTPGVVIYGGYEHPVCSGYPSNISLFSSISCSPCWLREPCPFDLKCLRMISPAEVETAVRTLWERSRPTA
jgi:ADP-heptose:LPS heptosyltransferase